MDLLSSEPNRRTGMGRQGSDGHTAGRITLRSFLKVSGYLFVGRIKWNAQGGTPCVGVQAAGGRNPGEGRK